MVAVKPCTIMCVVRSSTDTLPVASAAIGCENVAVAWEAGGRIELGECDLGRWLDVGIGAGAQCEHGPAGKTFLNRHKTVMKPPGARGKLTRSVGARPRAFVALLRRRRRPNRTRASPRARFRRCCEEAAK